MRRLSEIEAEFERIDRDMEPCDHRDIALGKLMSELEFHHGVPSLYSHSTRRDDWPAQELHKRISDARTFVLGMCVSR